MTRCPNCGALKHVERVCMFCGYHFEFEPGVHVFRPEYVRVTFAAEARYAAHRFADQAISMMELPPWVETKH